MPTDTILIVDDNPANQKLARVILQAEGYEIRTAADGEQAIAAIRAERPSLVLMDIQLPGMDGLEVTRRLRADEATRTIPIVAVTAYAMKGDRERAFEAGCDGYISKPIDPLALPSQIAEFLSAARTRK